MTASAWSTYGSRRKPSRSSRRTKSGRSPKRSAFPHLLRLSSSRCTTTSPRADLEPEVRDPSSRGSLIAADLWPSGRGGGVRRIAFRSGELLHADVLSTPPDVHDGVVP